MQARQAEADFFDQFLVEVDGRKLTRRELIGGALAGSAALSALGALTGRAQAAPARIRGGRFRVGVVGSGSSETLDPNKTISEIDIVRIAQLYEGLTDFDPNGRAINRLAAGFSPNSDATVWKVALRQGVEFHDGSPFTADDVVYSLRYILDPANKTTGASSLSFLKGENVRKLDTYTVELRLDQPLSVLPVALGERTIKIFKQGATADDLGSRPNGTGPFKFESWTRGERSLFVQNPSYRESGLPLLGEVEIISITDATARLSALIAGQIDALSQLDFKLIAVAQGAGNVKLVEKPSGAYTAPYMRLDRDPFIDNRVRQAFRYMVDRDQIIRQVLAGHGKIGNDLPSWFDADYAREIPQRPYDPERAKALLKAAGKERLTVTLHTSDAAPAMLDSSTLIAEQAKKVGVRIVLAKHPADQYYSGPYLKVTFANTNWGGRPLVPQYQLAYLRNAVYNETEWKLSKFDRLFAKALASPDAAKRHAILGQAQRLLWNQGGMIIWGFLNNLDAVSTKVQGITPSVIRPLGYYDFRRVSVT